MTIGGNGRNYGNSLDNLVNQKAHTANIKVIFMSLVRVQLRKPVNFADRTVGSSKETMCLGYGLLV